MISSKLSVPKSYNGTSVMLIATQKETKVGVHKLRAYRLEVVLDERVVVGGVVDGEVVCRWVVVFGWVVDGYVVDG